MGIQINGQTDTITAIDGQMTISGTDLSTNTLDLSTINATGVSTFAGNIDANGDLDVDGHTELDAVNVSGFLTATSAYYSGDVTVLGTLTYEDVTNVDVVGIATARAGLRINGGGLYVTGVSTFNGDLSITDKIVHEGDTDTAIRFPANDTITAETGGTERLRITSAGNIGIGTDNPQQTLDVNGDIRIKDARSLFFKRFGDDYAWRIRNESAANGSDGGYTGANTLLFEVISNSASQATSSTTSHAIYGSSVNTLALKESGRVGIGTDNPAVKLHLSSGTATQVMISNTSSSMSDGDTIGTIDFAAGPSNTVNARVAGAVEGTSEAGGDLVFETRADGGSLSERLRIDSSGSIGINTNAPGAKLDVRGSAFLSPLTLTAGGDGSWIKSSYGAISNSVVLSLNNLLIGQNMRGYLNSDGGSSNNNYYHTNTYSSGTMGYAGLEFCYGGIAKFFTGTPATTANATFTPTERLRINGSGAFGLSGANYGTSGQVLTSNGSAAAPQWATPAGGKILQVISTTKTDKFSTASTSFTDITGLSVTITPSSTSSKILVIYSIATAGRNSDYIGTYFRLVRGSTAICIGDAEGSRTRASLAQQNQQEFSQFGGGNFLDSPSTTSATTYKIQMKQDQGQTAYINADNMQNDQDNSLYGRYPSTITVIEVGA